MSTFVAGRSSGSAEEAAEAQVALSALLEILQAAAQHQLPGDAKIMLSVLASAAELMVRAPQFADISNEDVALAIALGLGSAVMKARGGYEVYPHAILHQLGVGFGQAVGSFVAEGAGTPERGQ